MSGPRTFSRPFPSAVLDRPARVLAPRRGSSSPPSAERPRYEEDPGKFVSVHASANDALEAHLAKLDQKYPSAAPALARAPVPKAAALGLVQRLQAVPAEVARESVVQAVNELADLAVAVRDRAGRGQISSFETQGFADQVLAVCAAIRGERPRGGGSFAGLSAASEKLWAALDSYDAATGTRPRLRLPEKG